MDMKGEYRIPAPRDRVWAALNDPDVLRRSIPGCEELTKHSENELEAKVTAKVGPVKAKFNGHVRLENINAPESYTISGEGKGGAAGFAKGGADVHLKEDGDDTILTYDAKAEVGGKLAQIGSRLIQGTAKKMADEFFGKFTEIVGDSHRAASADTATPPSAEPETTAPVGPVGDTQPAPEPAEAAPKPPPTGAMKEQIGRTTGGGSKPTSSTPPEADKGILGGLGKPAYIGIAVVVLILLLLLFT